MAATDGTPAPASSIPLDELTKCSPGTLMGRLLRSFWQPVAVACELRPGQAMQVRIFSEEFTLYRGESGAPYLVAPRCAHRGTRLDVGWIEDECIRCMYHGWKYDGRGQCVEMPAEDPSYPPRVRIPSYPVQEYAGLIFAYLGEGEPPAFDLPRHPAMERTDGIRVVNRNLWVQCNWFQSVENSLDATHVSFVHRWGRLGAFGITVSDVMPKLEYEEIDWGIRQTATRSPNNVRVSDWTFPNRNHVVSAGLTREDPWSETFAWALAQDEENELRFGVQFCPVQGDAAKRYEEHLLANGYEPTGIPNEYYGRHAYDPGEHRDDLFVRRILPESAGGLTNAQDYVAQAGQGVSADRSKERLGRSDAGVLFLRRIFLRELAAIRDGRPTKQWRRGGEVIPMPLQPWEHGKDEQGWDRKGVTSAPAAR